MYFFGFEQLSYIVIPVFKCHCLGRSPGSHGRIPMKMFLLFNHFSPVLRGHLSYRSTSCWTIWWAFMTAFTLLVLLLVFASMLQYETPSKRALSVLFCQCMWAFAFRLKSEHYHQGEIAISMPRNIRSLHIVRDTRSMNNSKLIPKR